MFASLPRNAVDFKRWAFDRTEPYYADLAIRSLTEQNIEAWLLDWTRLQELIEEAFWRLYAEMSADTTNEAARQAYETFIGEIQPQINAAEQGLKQKLLDSGLTVPGFEIPLRNMRSDADLFREANLPLLAEEKRLAAEWNKITGAQTVEWEGKQTTVTELRTVLLDPDRDRRQHSWELAMQRRLQDGEAINGIWQQLLALRRKLAANSDLPMYRDFRWRQLYRFDYTPDDCMRFHDAIEEVVVPAASEIYARRKERLGVESLRPWDLDVDLGGNNPLRPFEDVNDLIEWVGTIFQRLDPVLAGYYDQMRRENLLDLANRPNKGPGAWCTSFAAVRRPYIFMNAVGLHDDVMTLVHEAGHGFHWCESYAQPYFQQRGLDFIPIEMMEVASTSMEYLTAPYLLKSEGGFYSEVDLARARIDHLEGAILFWPFMVVVDAFQHWAYTNADDAAEPAKCETEWSALRRRYTPDVDWTGYGAELANGWRERPHIYDVPFYYVEYGLAQLGAIQVWRNSLTDLPSALAKYRHALSLGITRPLPELYAAAGAKLALDAATLRECVTLMRDTIAQLEATVASA